MYVLILQKLSQKNVIIQVESAAEPLTTLFVILLKYLIKMFPPLYAPHTGAAALHLLHCRG